MGQNFHETIRTIIVSMATVVCLLFLISTLNTCSQATDARNQQSMASCISKGKSWVKGGDSSFNCV